jgi:hypothetical protein
MPFSSCLHGCTIYGLAGHPSYGTPQTAYSPGFSFVEAAVGQITYTTAGPKVLRFTVTGKSSANRGYSTAIDSVRLPPPRSPYCLYGPLTKSSSYDGRML